MDRLKPELAALRGNQRRDLHSNMDRLKPTMVRQLMTANRIYIPIWID